MKWLVGYLLIVIVSAVIHRRLSPATSGLVIANRIGLAGPVVSMSTALLVIAWLLLRPTPEGSVHSDATGMATIAILLFGGSVSVVTLVLGWPAALLAAGPARGSRPSA